MSRADVPATETAPGEAPLAPPARSPSAPPVAPAASPAPAPTVPDEGALPGRRYLAWSVGALALAAGMAVVGALVGPDAPSPAGAFADSPWADGKVEVASYESRGTPGEASRPQEVVLTVSREPGSLKLVRSVVEPLIAGKGAGGARRRTLTVRVARLEPERLLDATLLAADDGVAFAFCSLAPRGASLVRRSHSLDGDREESLAGGAWLEDQLPLTLRARPLVVGSSFEVPLVPSVASGKAVAARIRVEAEETLATGVGELRCARVVVAAEGETLTTLWIGRESPRLLAGFACRDGGRGTLRAVERRVPLQDARESR